MSSIIQRSKRRRRKKILVVDDELDNTLVFSIGLEDNGFAVDSFTDPILALSNFKSDSYDILILDIKMPKMNGFELYDKLKKIDNKVKVCFLTAFGEGYHQEFRKRFPIYSSSNISFVRKPIRIAELVKEIKSKLD